MSSTIVGCFDSHTEARAVEAELIANGIDRDRIHLTAESGGQQSQRTAGRDEPGVWDSIKEAFGFADDADRATYAEATRRGGTLVSVEADEGAGEAVAKVMIRHNVVDLDQRASQWQQQGWAGVQAAGQQTQGTQQTRQTQATAGAQAQARTAEGQEVIPVVQEELRVGKRAVQQGGVRVYSRVTERPVEEQVDLREEHVQVERRPVDRPIGDADRAFQERTIEATQMAEEAVVDKQARVVEEVAVNKDVQQRTETIRDSVRRTDVDVQQVPGQEAASTTYSDTFINEFASDERYRGRDWNAMEPDVRRSFEQRYPDNRWDEYRDRVRSGYERMRGRA